MDINNVVYFVSDHTGITVEGLGRSLLSQFKGVHFQYVSQPFIDDLQKAKTLVDHLEQRAQSGDRVMVFTTIVDLSLRTLFNQKSFEHFDLFGTYLPRLEMILQKEAVAQTGRSHGVVDTHKYMTRIEAIDFTLMHDDGLNAKHYEEADIILVGVSRSGKTPTCLYMAIQYGLRAANYPMTEEDLAHGEFPSILRGVKKKLFGLLIDAQRLHEIRQQRLPNSRYASLMQCEKELAHVEQFFRHENIPFLNTTTLSIEEIATQILTQAGLQKRLY